MKRNKLILIILFSAFILTAAQSCGIFKKDCGCPDPFKTTKRK